jgi:hypothetical protein
MDAIQFFTDGGTDSFLVSGSMNLIEFKISIASSQKDQ